MRKAYIFIFLLPALAFLFFLGSKYLSPSDDGDSQSVATKIKKKKNSKMNNINQNLNDLKKSVENEINIGMQKRDIASDSDSDSTTDNNANQDSTSTPVAAPTENPEVLKILANLGVDPRFSLKLSMPGENFYESKHKVVSKDKFDESTMGKAVGEINGMVIFIPNAKEANNPSYYPAIVNGDTWQPLVPTGLITCVGNEDEIKNILLSTAELQMESYNGQVRVAFIKQRAISPPGRLVQVFNQLIENIPSGSKVSCNVDFRLRLSTK